MRLIVNFIYIYIIQIIYKITNDIQEYRIHWNKGPWAVKFQRPFFGSQAPMGAYLGGRLIGWFFCVPGERQMK